MQNPRLVESGTTTAASIGEGGVGRPSHVEKDKTVYVGNHIMLPVKYLVFVKNFSTLNFLRQVIIKKQNQLYYKIQLAQLIDALHNGRRSCDIGLRSLRGDIDISTTSPTVLNKALQCPRLKSEALHMIGNLRHHLFCCCLTLGPSNPSYPYKLF